MLQTIQTLPSLETLIYLRIIQAVSFQLINMTAKRPPPGTIHQRTLEYLPDPPPPPSQPIEQRTILKVIQEDKQPQLKDTPKQDQQPPKEHQKQSEKEEQSEKKEEQFEKKEEKVEDKKSLFSNLFQNKNFSNPGVGLFANLGSKPDIARPKIDLSGPKLFSNNGFKPNQNEEKPKSIFQTEGSGKHFFQNFKNNNESVFNFGNKSNIPPVRNGEEDDSGDSEDLEKAQDMTIDKSKSSARYEYEDEVKLLFSGGARKYKKNNGDLVQGVEVIFQHDEKSNQFYFLVRLMATKRNILTGFILAHKSSVRILNGKQQNLEIGVFVVNKNNKVELNKVKVQLDTSENGKELLSKLKDVISGKISSQKKEPVKEEKEKEEKVEKQADKGKQEEKEGQKKE